MSKNATNAGKKYRFEWVGVNTGFNYRLDVSPSYDDANGGTLTVTNEAPTGLMDFELSFFEYDKLYLGLSSPQCKFEFNLDYCSSDFVSILLDPITIRQLNYLTLFNEEVVCSNRFELFIEFVDVNPGYQKVYDGIQTTSLAALDVANKVYPCETESIWKYLTSQIKFGLLVYLESVQRIPASTVNRYTHETVYDWARRTEDNKFVVSRSDYIRTGSTQFAGNFLQLNNLFEGINRVFGKYLATCIRSASTIEATVLHDNNFTFMPTFYKQSLKKTNARNGVLNSTDIYALFTVMSDNVDTVEALDGEGGNSDGVVFTVGAEYPCVWDFLQDISQSCLRKSYISTTSGGSPSLVFPTLLSSDAVTLTDYELSDIEVTIGSDVLNSVEVAPLDVVDDDVDVVEVGNLANRTGDKYSITSIFHNVPIFTKTAETQIQSKDFVLRRVGRNTQPERIYRNLGKGFLTNKIKPLGLYYRGSLIDSDSLQIPELTGDQIIRVNESCLFDFGDGLDSDDIYTVPNVIWGDLQTEDDAARLDCALSSGVYRVLAESVLSVFGDVNQTRIKGKADLRVGLYYDSPYVVSPLINPTIQVDYDLTSLEPSAGAFDILPNEFYCTSSKLTKDEIIEFELLSRGV